MNPKESNKIVNMLSNFTKLKNPKTSYSLLAAALFIFYSHPETYKFVNQYINGVSDKKGCPETKGLIVHAVVFLLMYRIVMEYV